MKCNKCGQENLDNGVFCTNCGTKLGDASEKKIHCPNCGKENSDHNDFCEECGYGFLTKKMPNNEKPQKSQKATHYAGYQYVIAANIFGLILGFFLVLFPFISIGSVGFSSSFNLITIFALFNHNFVDYVDAAYITGASFGLLKVLLGLALIGLNVSNLIIKNKENHCAALVFIILIVIAINWGIFGTYFGADILCILLSFLVFVFISLSKLTLNNQKTGKKVIFWVGSVLLAISFVSFIGNTYFYPYNGILALIAFAKQNNLDNNFIYIGLLSSIIVIVSLFLMFFTFVKPNFKIASIAGVVNSLLIIAFIITNNVVAQALGYIGSPIATGVVSLVFCLVGTMMIFVYYLNDRKKVVIE